MIAEQEVLTILKVLENSGYRAPTLCVLTQKVYDELHARNSMHCTKREDIRAIMTQLVHSEHPRVRKLVASR